MSQQPPFNTLLVPTDFSEASREALQWALTSMESANSVVILLHVLDESFIESVADHQFDERDEIVRRLRSRAQERLDEYKQSSSATIEIETIVSEGIPFVEILRKARDFAVDAIVMSRVGARGPFEELLFGSTAEKVLRVARQPVIVLPQSKRG